MKRIPNNTAGIEFAAHLENIKDFLRLNYKAAHIHRLLKEAGKITMSYGAFCYQMHRLCSQNANKPKAPAKTVPVTPSVQAAPSRPQRQPGIIKVESKTFPDPRAMDSNNLI